MTSNKMACSKMTGCHCSFLSLFFLSFLLLPINWILKSAIMFFLLYKRQTQKFIFLLHLYVQKFISTFLCLMQVVSKQSLFRITFDPSDRRHNNKVCKRSSMILWSFSLLKIALQAQKINSCIKSYETIFSYWRQWSEVDNQHCVKCRNTQFCLVQIRRNKDEKNLRHLALFTQCKRFSFSSFQ